MTPFTASIKINNRLTEFNFRKVLSPQQDKFFISTVDPRGTSICFDMTMNPQGQWNIVKPVPDYVEQIKGQLIKIVSDHCHLIMTPFI